MKEDKGRQKEEGSVTAKIGMKEDRKGRKKKEDKRKSRGRRRRGKCGSEDRDEG